MCYTLIMIDRKKMVAMRMTEDEHRRLRVLAAHRGISQGRLVAGLVEREWEADGEIDDKVMELRRLASGSAVFV